MTNDASTRKSGRGHFTATPLEFELNGEKHTYAGRVRWSVELATKVVNEGQAPQKSKTGEWSWRPATVAESSSAQALVNKIASKLKAKAEKAAAKVAGKATKGKTIDAPVTPAAAEEVA